MLWITLKADDLSSKFCFWNTGSLPIFFKENLKYLCFPSLHTQFWWQLMKFISFETHKPDFLFRILFFFLAHEYVWYFRGHTPVRSTGKSVWIKMFQIIWLYWSVLQWRTSSLRNLIFLTSLSNFSLLLLWIGMHTEISLSLGLLVTARLNWVVGFGLLLLAFFSIRINSELHRKQFWLNWLSEWILFSSICVLWKHYFVWPAVFSSFKLYCVVLAN